MSDPKPLTGADIIQIAGDAAELAVLELGGTVPIDFAGADPIVQLDTLVFMGRHETASVNMLYLHLTGRMDLPASPDFENLTPIDLMYFTCLHSLIVALLPLEQKDPDVEDVGAAEFTASFRKDKGFTKRPRGYRQGLKKFPTKSDK